MELTSWKTSNLIIFHDEEWLDQSGSFVADKKEILDDNST
jgi:hypothetical protein